MSELRIQFESLTRAGGELARAAEQIDGALSRLRTGLEQQGEPWGNDEVGAPFAQAYTAVMRQAFTAIASYRDQVGYAAERLPAAAERLRAAEAENKSEFKETEFAEMWRIPEER